MTQLDYVLNLGARIGGGFFGDVYLATDDIHGQVAVKVLRRLPGEPDAAWDHRKDQLFAEGRHMEAAKHQNIVQVYHVGRTAAPARDVHLVMEHCPGGSLLSEYE